VKRTDSNNFEIINVIMFSFNAKGLRGGGEKKHFVIKYPGNTARPSDWHRMRVKMLGWLAAKT
jgi:hypothetical protein